MTNSQVPSILIVDDNPDNLKIIGSFLRKEGYTIRLAQSGPKAIESATAAPPDLILLDVSMPGMDGYETCKRLYHIDGLSHIPIIFITAERKGTESMLEGFKAGAVDYIEKPVESAVIAARVKLHLNLLQARRALEQRNRELEEINNWKTKLIGILGHDLRNPISGFLGLTEVMLKDLDSFSKDVIQEYLQELHKAAQNTESILENILYWVSASTQSSAKPVSFPIHPLINEVFEQLSHGAAQKSIRLIEPSISEAFVFADREMTQTIIRNFVANAIKFTPSGGTIRVELRQEKEFQEIDVIDTGIGIPPEKQKNLFTNNVELMRGTEGEKGSGLGLLICKELAERQGGFVGVESELGKGSRFFLRLPTAAQS